MPYSLRIAAGAVIGLGLSLSLTAAAQSKPSEAARLLGERQALLSLDARCGLLTPMARAGLSAATAQAGEALVRGGWTRAAVAARRDAAAEAALGLACDGPAVTAAVSSARQGYALWIRQHDGRFPGRHAVWSARRTPDPEGWFLWQDLAPAGRFGLRVGAEGPRLMFAAPVAAGRTVASARLLVRDPAKAAAPPSVLALPKADPALARTAPAAADAAVYLATARAQAKGLVELAFDDRALARLAALDSREAAAIDLVFREGGAPAQRFLIEAGDLAAARAFLLAVSE